MNEPLHAPARWREEPGPVRWPVEWRPAVRIIAAIVVACAFATAGLLRILRAIEDSDHVLRDVVAALEATPGIRDFEVDPTIPDLVIERVDLRLHVEDGGILGLHAVTPESFRAVEHLWVHVVDDYRFHVTTEGRPGWSDALVFGPAGWARALLAIECSNVGELVAAHEDLRDALAGLEARREHTLELGGDVFHVTIEPARDPRQPR